MNDFKIRVNINSDFPVFPSFTKSHLSQLLVIVPQKKAALKSSIFWAISPCSPLRVNRHVGGTYHLLLQVEV
jgi:hypothetical protein